MHPTDQPRPARLTGAPPDIVLFDIDGTLLDTREFILAAFEHALLTVGAAIPARPFLAEQVGRPLDQVYGELAAPALAPHLCEIHRAFQLENLDLAVVFPGVADVLGRLAHAGVTMAAVTSRSRRTSTRTLELAGIAGWFAAVVSGEDAPAIKPDPAPLKMAIELARAKAGRAVMVGDTGHDVLAGKRIGALTVAALYGFGPSSALAAGPDHTIEDIVELPAIIGL